MDVWVTLNSGGLPSFLFHGVDHLSCTPVNALVQSLAQGRSPLNTHAGQWYEPHRIPNENVVTKPSAGAVALLDSGLGCQPGVKAREGILSIP